MRVHILLSLCLCLSLSACDTGTNPAPEGITMQLTPLSPYRYSFSGVTGESRNDYFFIDAGHGREKGFRDALRTLVSDARPEDAEGLERYSIYVYERTSVLDESFQGSADDLRGVHDKDLVAYARWDRGRLDVFYLIESGQVVFDLLANEPVPVPWEFD